MGALVPVIIWGGLLYMVVGGMFPGGVFSSSLSAATLDAPSSTDTVTTHTLSIGDERGGFVSAEVHVDGLVDIYDIAVHSRDERLIAVNSSAGLLLSRDGGKHFYPYGDLEQRLPSGTPIYKIMFDARTGDAFISAFRDSHGVLYKTSDNFSSIESVLTIFGEAVYDFALTSQYYYLGLSDGRLLRYTPSTEKYHLIASFSSPIVTLRLGSEGRRMYLRLKSGEFLVSNDLGVTFTPVAPFVDYGDSIVNSFLLDSLNSRIVYAATPYGFFHSHDAGGSWDAFRYLPTGGSNVSAVVLHPTTGALYAASGRSIFVSTDSGVNWSVLNPGLNNRYLSVIRFNRGTMLVGSTAPREARESSFFDIFRPSIGL